MRPLIAVYLLFICIKFAFAHPVLSILNNSYAIPYFVNLTAINLLSDDANLPKVKSYIMWYLNHLNYPDKYGLTGTIYDYYITSDVESSLESYDSADSYSATFLFLVYLYVQKSGDYNLVKENLQKLKDIAYVIAYLQDSDGLVKALPNINLKYLVDNIENICGLRTFSLLLRELGDHDWRYYFIISHNIENSVMKELIRRGRIAWAKLDDYLYIAGDSVVYPDIYAKAVFYSFVGKPIPKGWYNRFDYFQKTVISVVRSKCRGF